MESGSAEPTPVDGRTQVAGCPDTVPVTSSLAETPSRSSSNFHNKSFAMEPLNALMQLHATFV